MSDPTARDSRRKGKSLPAKRVDDSWHFLLFRFQTQLYECTTTSTISAPNTPSFTLADDCRRVQLGTGLA